MAQFHVTLSHQDLCIAVEDFVKTRLGRLPMGKPIRFYDCEGEIDIAAEELVATVELSPTDCDPIPSG